MLIGGLGVQSKMTERPAADHAATSVTSTCAMYSDAQFCTEEIYLLCPKRLEMSSDGIESLCVANVAVLHPP